MVVSSVIFRRRTSILFSWWLPQFAFPPTEHESSLSSTFSTAFVLTCLFDESYSLILTGVR